MAIKSREPYFLDNADFLTFMNEIIDWVDAQISAGTYPTHLPADLDTLRDNYQNALTDYNSKRELYHDEATPQLKVASDAVYLRLRSFKNLLPTLFGGDKTVLAAFGIADALPIDRDDLFVVATSCQEHWDDITSSAVPAEYTPVEPYFIEFATEMTTFNAELGEFIDATRDAEDAQNLVLQEREACQKQERLVFNWYRGLHLNPRDEWWTGTPWGASSGGDAPAAPLNFRYDDTDSTFKWSTVDDATEYELHYRLVDAAGDWTQLYKGTDNFYQGLPDVPGSYDFRVRAIVNDKLGNWALGVVVEVL